MSHILQLPNYPTCSRVVKNICHRYVTTIVLESWFSDWTSISERIWAWQGTAFMNLKMEALRYDSHAW